MTVESPRWPQSRLCDARRWIPVNEIALADEWREAARHRDRPGPEGWFEWLRDRARRDIDVINATKGQDAR